MLLIGMICSTTSATGLENTDVVKDNIEVNDRVSSDVLIAVERYGEQNGKPKVNCLEGSSHINGDTHWHACVTVESGNVYFVAIVYNSSGNLTQTVVTNMTHWGCSCSDTW